MKLRVDVVGDFEAIMRENVLNGERAVTRTMRAAGRDLKARWRQRIVAAGLGRRLSNTIREKSYPPGDVSLNAATLVYVPKKKALSDTRAVAATAAEVIDAHHRGVIIRAVNKFWMAIPTPAAGRAPGGRRFTPSEWKRARGIELRAVRSAKTGNIFLVADDVRIATGKRTKGTAVRKGGRRRKDGILTGAQSAVIFVLVPQVRLRKRFDLARDVEQVAAGIPAQIVSNWKGLD